MCILDALLDLGEEWHTELVAGAEDHMVYVVDIRSVREVEPSGIGVDLGDLLFQGDVGVRERFPPERRDGVSPERGVDWRLGKRQDLVKNFMRRHRSSYDNNALRCMSVGFPSNKKERFICGLPCP